MSGRFTKPTADPRTCDHSTSMVGLCGYTTTKDYADEHYGGDTELDAVDFCLDCHCIRLWGVGWMVPPPPSPEMQQRLAAILHDGTPCDACGWLMGENATCDNDECPTWATDHDDRETETEVGPMPESENRNSELEKWLNRNNAVHQWGLTRRTDQGHVIQVESYVLRGGGRVILEIHPEGNGWEIWSNDGGNSIVESLADAERRAVHGNAPKHEMPHEWRERLMRDTEGLGRPVDILAALKADFIHNGPPPRELEGPKLKHREDLLWQLAQGLRAHEGMGDLGNLEVRWLKGDELVKTTSVPLGVDYLANDIHFDESADWSECDTLQVEVAGA